MTTMKNSVLLACFEFMSFVMIADYDFILFPERGKIVILPSYSSRSSKTSTTSEYISGNIMIRMLRDYLKFF